MFKKENKFSFKIIKFSISQLFNYQLLSNEFSPKKEKSFVLSDLIIEMKSKEFFWLTLTFYFMSFQVFLFFYGLGKNTNHLLTSIKISLNYLIGNCRCLLLYYKSTEKKKRFKDLLHFLKSYENILSSRQILKKKTFVILKLKDV